MHGPLFRTQTHGWRCAASLSLFPFGASADRLEPAPGRTRCGRSATAPQDLGATAPPMAASARAGPGLGLLLNGDRPAAPPRPRSAPGPRREAPVSTPPNEGGRFRHLRRRLIWTPLTDAEPACARRSPRLRPSDEGGSRESTVPLAPCCPRLTYGDHSERNSRLASQTGEDWLL